MKRTAVIVLALALLAVPVALAAISTTTQVNFNIATVVAYTLTLPGMSAVNANSTGAPTNAIEFNSTNGLDQNVEAKVTGGTTQSPGTPIFTFGNTGTVPLNISISLNSNVQPCITFKGNTTDAGANGATTTITTSTLLINSSLSPQTGSFPYYLKASFTNCAATDTSVRTLTSTGVQT